MLVLILRTKSSSLRCFLVGCQKVIFFPLSTHNCHKFQKFVSKQSSCFWVLGIRQGSPQKYFSCGVEILSQWTFSYFWCNYQHTDDTETSWAWWTHFGVQFVYLCQRFCLHRMSDLTDYWTEQFNYPFSFMLSNWYKTKKPWVWLV